jgi:hypothetical protein
MKARLAGNLLSRSATSSPQCRVPLRLRRSQGSPVSRIVVASSAGGPVTGGGGWLPSGRKPDQPGRNQPSVSATQLVSPTQASP